MIVMTFSWLFATFFFQSLCCVIGPNGNFAQIYIIQIVTSNPFHNTSPSLLIQKLLSNGLICLISVLQDTTLALDFRVTALEENGGGDGNSSVAELEVRVETLEGTAADHETRISAAETDITGG